MAAERAVAGRHEGRRIVVTGASGGIGQAICDRLAAEGARVAMIDAHPPLRPVPGAVVILADLSTAAGCAAAAAQVRERLGTPEVLVPAAGINRRGDLLHLSPEDWETSLGVNLGGVVHLCRSLLPAMIADGGGVVVALASQWGLQPAPGHLAYNASKAALVSVVRGLALDHGPQGIRAVAVCPGEILTPMLRARMERTGRDEREMAAAVPLRRLGRPEDVAALVAFLASEDASFVSGTAVEITGAQPVA